MKKTLFLFFLLLGIGICGEAYAGDASPIFDSLAEKAAAIGKGLRDSGFLIAGFGLIVFSFMAIFNKISWKMLAYIMFSTFILSTMVGIIGYISNGQSNARFMDIQSTGAGGESMDPTQAQVGKDGGSPQYGSGTGGQLPDLKEIPPASPEALMQSMSVHESNDDVSQPIAQEQETATDHGNAGSSQFPQLTQLPGLTKKDFKRLAKADPDVFGEDGSITQPNQVDLASLSDSELKAEIEKNKNAVGWLNYSLNTVVYSPPLTDEEKNALEQLKSYYEKQESAAKNEKKSRKK